MKRISEAFTKEDILKIGIAEAIDQFNAISDEDFMKMFDDKDRDWNASNTSEGLYINVWDVGIELGWTFENLFYYIIDEDNRKFVKNICKKAFEERPYSLEKMNKLFRTKDYEDFVSSFIEFEKIKGEDEFEREFRKEEAEMAAVPACEEFLADIYWLIDDEFDRYIIADNISEVRKEIIDEIASWE